MTLFRRARPSPFRYITLPNLVSYLSFLCALGAMHEAARGEWHLTGAFIAGSALADMFDGKFARLFKRSAEQGKFGAQLDSLIDVVAFGVTPLVALRMLAFATTEAGKWWWGICASAYLLATVTRLGYFNVHQAAPGKSVFVGLPTTFVGMLWGILYLWTGTMTWGPALFLVFAFLMLLPVEFDRPKGWAFAPLPITCVVGIVANWLAR
ncbi:MAG TPA: CDP-alcohol phosphatidyltransferase family protein [Bdellovibrionota bacterium]|nr:CDP-alcohol phosphatidyltransferase family protein [Bdellovibrionota bacterium]